MLGKARDIGTHFVEGEFIDEIEAKITTWLEGNKDLLIVDIRHQVMYCKDSVNLYHTALIIYKMEESQ